MDRNKRITKPKYEIIKEALLERIRTGQFSSDAVFCTEKMLSEQYEVSRITAKRAIEDHFYNRRKHIMKTTVHIISHSHWDREWYQSFEKHRMKLIELVDNILEKAENDPEFGGFFLYCRVDLIYHIIKKRNASVKYFYVFP